MNDNLLLILKIIIYNSLYINCHCFMLDCAGVTALGEAEVSLFTPVLAPGVLHAPELIPLVAREEHAVIDYGLLTGVHIHHSTRIGHETGGVNTHWKWLRGERLFER